MQRHLPGVREALKRQGGDTNLLVVDDASTDGSRAWLNDKPHGVETVFLDRQHGFAGASTAGIRAAEEGIVILLNTDVDVEPGFIEPLLEALADVRVFCAQSLVLQPDGQTVDESVKVPRWNMEKVGSHELRMLPRETVQQSLSSPTATLFASGGFMAFHRNAFLAIGGFDPLYEPFYYEDVDLSYRAWKRGMRVVLAPHSVVIHRHHEGSIATQHKSDQIHSMVRRNRLLFIWKNITDPGWFRARHIPWLLSRALVKCISWDHTYVQSLRSALLRARLAHQRRNIERIEATLTDQEVWQSIIDENAPHILGQVEIGT